MTNTEMIALLRSPSQWLRLHAAASLGLPGNQAAVPALIEAMADEAANVRTMAALALGDIGDPRGMPALVGASKDPDASVRKAAALALKKFNQQGLSQAA